MKFIAAIMTCFLLGTAGACAAEPQKKTLESVKASDESILFAEPSDAADNVLLDDRFEELPASAVEPGASVHISQEFGFGSRQNIDSFLGEFENPYAAPEDTYSGSRSEMRDDVSKRPY